MPLTLRTTWTLTGTLDIHIKLEQDIADFLGTEASIIYSQAFSTISSVIPAFAKRGDVIVADRGVNFAIQKGLQISRCTIRWYDHNDMDSLEHVLETVEKERRKRKAPLTRRFIVTEGIFDHDGAMSDLPKLVRASCASWTALAHIPQVELKKKYKYRLILDESISFGSVGRTGRGLTELYNVPVSDSPMKCNAHPSESHHRHPRSTCLSVPLQLVSRPAVASVLAPTSL